MNTKNPRLVIICLIFILTFSPCRTIATSQAEKTDKFVPFADAYVDNTNENSNYGSADLRVGWYTFTETTWWIEDTFIAFEVEGLPNDAVVTNVKLELSVKSMPVDDHSKHLIIQQSSQSFSENALTYENRPIGGFTGVGGGTIMSDSRWEFTLDNDYHTITQNGIFYFRIYTDTDNMWSITLDSRDDIWNPPKLAVTYTYTPEATTNPATTTTSNSIFEDGSYNPLYSLLGLAILGGGGFALVYWKVILPKKKLTEGTVAQQKTFTPTQRFCTNCGNLMPTGDFCQKCGMKK